MTASDPTTERVRALVAPIVADLRLDLYDLEFRGGTLRVTLDTPTGSEGGVDLDTIALATRLISRELDHHDPIPGHYTLEVTSPGLERSLRTPEHFRREIGKTVAVRLRDVVAGERRLQGVLIDADERTATLRLEEPAADGSDTRVVEIDRVDRARTVFVWGPTPKQGGPRQSKRSRSAAPQSAATDHSGPESERSGGDTP